MRFIENVDENRFNEFAIAHPLNHYSKTSFFIPFKKQEYSKGDLVGVEDENGSLIASAVVLHKRTKIPFGQYSYCQYGFNLDYENRELLDFFLAELLAFAKRKGSYFLRIDPNITRLEHDKSGHLVEGGFNHEFVTDAFIKNGYTHLGYNYGYSGNWMSRFTYRLDLDKPWKEIEKGIKRGKQYKKKNDERLVSVHKAGRDELNVLVMGQEELSQTRGFTPYGMDYFQRLWDCYEPYVHYYVVDVNYHQAKLNLQKMIDDNEKHITILKDQNKIAMLEKSNAAMRKEILEIEEKGLDVDQVQPLGAKFIVMQGVNVWNINMYTMKTLMNFRGAFALHRYAIEDLYHQGAKTYDFEGISGSLDPNDYYYGQQDFKKSFGGDFLEFLGEFDGVISPGKYKLWKEWDYFYRRARRKIGYIFHKK